MTVVLSLPILANGASNNKPVPPENGLNGLITDLSKVLTPFDPRIDITMSIDSKRGFQIEKLDSLIEVGLLDEYTKDLYTNEKTNTLNTTLVVGREGILGHLHAYGDAKLLQLDMTFTDLEDKNVTLDAIVTSINSRYEQTFHIDKVSITFTNLISSTAPDIVIDGKCDATSEFLNAKNTMLKKRPATHLEKMKECSFKFTYNRPTGEYVFKTRLNNL